MPPTITESRFADLKAKLRELFELDKSDLDFGIYRIIAAKNAEVTEFLDRQLKDVVRKTLDDHGAGAAERDQADLDKTLASLRAAEVPEDQIQTNKKVVELRAEIAAAGGGTIAELEADIYNHLLAFFGRYYDEGDFISQRRYKGDTYAIPYSGEEVTLHWANKDQYYIKSGEWHKDYRFKVGGGGHGGSKSVRFKLVEATQETGNNKEADDAKHRYILASTDPVEATDTELTLRFEFRTPTPKERERAESGAVAIFGGDYAKEKNPKKGDERDQFCADAENRALKALSKEGKYEAWRPIVGALAATDSKPFRTILGKHLDHFTARNTFDYFIHKDLRKFLRLELDFYIKNEVVRLDDLETLPPEHLQRVQGKVKAIRTVATRLIKFLASLEDFQKKMWLKKKFVLNTNWLVTVDRIPAKLRDIVAANKAQWKEWEELGFKPTKEQEGDGLFKKAKWGTRAYLDACDKLVVDTALYERAFKEDVMAELSASSDGCPVARDTMGVLVHSENWQALRLLEAEFRRQVGAMYIDPPYNTGTGDFLYKDNYFHSSWMALMQDRLEAGVPFLAVDGVLFSSIDDGEQATLRGVLDRVFGPENFIANVIWQKKYAPQNDATWMSDDHDFVLVYARDRATWRPRKLARSDKQNESYRNPDNDERGPWKADNYKTNKTAEQRPNLYFPIIHPKTGEEVWPLKSAVWRYTRETHERNVREGRVWWGRDGSAQVPAYKRFLSDVEGVVPRTIWMHDEVGHNQDGVRELQDLFGENPFPSPKPVGLVDRALSISTCTIVADFFAGSGTTAHAAIAQGREGGDALRFLLIDMGPHFISVIRPRVTKVIYSPDWKDGSAQSHDKGVSALVKYFALESYEDALNNLPAPSGTLIADADAATKDALITYAFDLEMGPHLLNLDAFRDPWEYTMNAQLAGDAEIKKHRVDLVETFNYLIGLKVHAYGPIERFDPEFVKAKHEDGLGRLKVKPHPGAVGGLKRDANGPYAFQRVEGEINPALTGGSVFRVLIVWRKLTGDAEKDAAVLEAWMARHHENTKERSEHRDYQLIYINGPVTLAQPTAEIRTVLPIEETFKAKMFEDTEGGA